MKITGCAPTGTAYSSSVEILSKIRDLRKVVCRMYCDFPILHRTQREKGLVMFPFNLPSRDFMQSLDEDISEVSNELEIFLSQSLSSEDREMRDCLVKKLESVEMIFEDIHTKVLKLDPVRARETLAEIEEADGCFSTSLESLLLDEHW